MKIVRVTMRELNSKSSEIVRRAIAGDHVVVTRRGVPVAEIMPMQGHPEPARREDILDAFQRVGAIDRDRFRRDMDAVVDQSV